MKARVPKISMMIPPHMGVDYSDEPLTVINDDLSVFKGYPSFNFKFICIVSPAMIGESWNWKQMFNTVLMECKERISYKDPRLFAIFGPYCRVAYDTLFIHIEGLLRSAARTLTLAEVKPCHVQLELHAIGKVGRISLTVRKLKHFGGM